MMGVGIPVVSTDIGGISELLKPMNSVIVPHDAEAADYVQELVRLLFLEKNPETISEAAVQFVRAMNSHEQYEKTILGVLTGSDCFSREQVLISSPEVA